MNEAEKEKKYNEICKKLGCDPFHGGYPVPEKVGEDDSEVSMFSILTDEEQEFLALEY